MLWMGKYGGLDVCRKQTGEQDFQAAKSYWWLELEVNWKKNIIILEEL